MSSVFNESLAAPIEAPELLRSETPIPVRCRCGTRVPSGGEVVEIAALPESLEGVFGGVVFCSAKCLRAFCLESLETLDALDTPDARETVSDLHELTMEVAMTLVSILGA